MNLARNWKPVIDRFLSKLSLWKAKTLSFGGRLTLIKSVLGNLPTYYFSLFRAPTGVLNTLEKIRRNFLWGGGDHNTRKINWVAWDRVLAEKKEGGLGVGSLHALNTALILKWWWRLRKEPEILWCKIIGGLHNISAKPDNSIANKSIPGNWKNIAEIKSNVASIGLNPSDIFEKSVLAGDRTLFWYDTWVGPQPFSLRFPGLFAMEKLKRCKMMDRVRESGLCWSWRAALPDSLNEELHQLQCLLSSWQFTTSPDTWRCKLVEDGVYLVEHVRKIIDKPINPFPGGGISWLADTPIKVRCFIWRAIIGRIPSAVALSKRGLSSISTSCDLCNGVEEDADHILAHCPFALEVWGWIFGWCKLPISAFSTAEIVDFAAKWGRKPKEARNITAICYGTLWAIWKERNARRFNNSRTPARIIADNTISLVYGWLKHRRPDFRHSWSDWCTRPLG